MYSLLFSPLFTAIMALTNLFTTVSFIVGQQRFQLIYILIALYYYLSSQKHYYKKNQYQMTTKTSNFECRSTPNIEYRYKRIKDYVYDMEAVLGKGNFSIVYQAIRENTNELYAVKVVKLASLTFKKLEELLEQEISIIKSLDHPNVIRCTEVLKSTNHCYFITELCDGGNLQKTLKERGAMNQEEIWPIVNQIFQGLKYLSSKNIIHRDIKPANIFIKEQVIKIADFGFAIQSNQPFVDFSIGSPLYMSPEGYLHNRYGSKTDVWAFGIVLYELLHGKQPLLQCKNDEDLKTSISKNIGDDYFTVKISLELKDLIKKCLEVDVAKRITFQEIEKSAYFQRYNNVRSMAEIRMINCERRPSMPLRKNGGKFETSLRNLDDPYQKVQKAELKAADKENVRYKQPLKLPMRIQKRRTRLLNIDIRQIQQNKSLFVECCSKDLLKGDLMFNQSIGLIHFCRIGFKLTHEDVGEDLSRCIKSLIIKLLSEMQMRVNLGLIRYDVEGNRAKKQSKLKLVICEYMSKYEKELKGERKVVNTNQIINRLLNELDQNQIIGSNQLMFKCYLSMIFLSFTEELVRCIEKRNYKLFGDNGVIDACLDEKQIPKTITDYLTAKKKYYKHQK